MTKAAGADEDPWARPPGQKAYPKAPPVTVDDRVSALEKRVTNLEQKVFGLGTTTGSLGYGGEAEWKKLYDQVKRQGWGNFWVGKGTSGYVDAYFPSGFKGLADGAYTAKCYGSEGTPWIERTGDDREMPRSPAPAAQVPPVQIQQPVQIPTYGWSRYNPSQGWVQFGSNGTWTVADGNAVFGDCADGQCAVPQQPQRRGLFGRLR